LSKFFRLVFSQVEPIFSWGNNQYGQLGLKHNENSNIPQQTSYFYQSIETKEERNDAYFIDVIG